MVTLSYTKSLILTTQLEKIDHLRKDLLLLPLSPLDELKLQWESQVKQIYYSLALNGILVPEEQITTQLLPFGTKSISPHKGLITSYRKAHDYLYHNWLVNKRSVAGQDLLDFYNEAFVGQLSINPDQLETSLRYIQVNPEHPVIQASLAQILLITLSPFKEYNEQFSQLVFQMFMYKYGYDMRRLPVYAEFFYHDLFNYKDMMAKSSRQQNVTVWLEYMARSLISQLTKTLNTLNSVREESAYHKQLFTLNDRQRSILTLFNQPDVKISNKMVQRKYKVSQITASRDLSKLATLGVIFPIGKGRSTYYTKV